MSIFDETKTITFEPEAIEIIKQSLNIYLNSLSNQGTSDEMMAIDRDYVATILSKL